LVLHRRDDTSLPVEVGRYVAQQVPGARFVELEGRDHLPWVGTMEPFLGGIFSSAFRIASATRSVVSAVARSTRRETACSQPSTVRRGRSAVPSRFAMPS